MWRIENNKEKSWASLFSPLSHYPSRNHPLNFMTNRKNSLKSLKDILVKVWRKILWRKRCPMSTLNMTLSVILGFLDRFWGSSMHGACLIYVQGFWKKFSAATKVFIVNLHFLFWKRRFSASPDIKFFINFPIGGAFTFRKWVETRFYFRVIGRVFYQKSDTLNPIFFKAVKKH